MTAIETAEYAAYRDRRDCTRPAKSTGSKCIQPKVSWPKKIQMPDPRACRYHLTDEERAALIEHGQLMSARHVARFGSFGTPEGLERARIRSCDETPACWRWPAPQACTFADEESAERFFDWWHQGMCAICWAPGELVTDHDHVTGLVRGLLCRSCNALEGHADDTGRFGAYRRRNPASIVGVKIRYWSPMSGYAEPAPPRHPSDRAALREAGDRMLSV